MSSDLSLTLRTSVDEQNGELTKSTKCSSSASSCTSFKKGSRTCWDPEVLSDTDILSLDEQAYAPDRWYAHTNSLVGHSTATQIADVEKINAVKKAPNTGIFIHCKGTTIHKSIKLQYTQVTKDSVGQDTNERISNI
eukprot:14389310-Ditylum_brightwellii.AAC.1